MRWSTTGARPKILTAPGVVTAGTEFSIHCATEGGGPIAKLSLIRHGSVTHSMNQSQGICFPQFKPDGDGKFLVKIPETTRACAPGPYMLFAISKAGVPSIAHLLMLQRYEPVAQPGAPVGSISIAVAEEPQTSRATVGREEANDVAVEKAKAAGLTRVTVGITPTCPHGISACWGGAVEGLRNLEGVVLIERRAEPHNSVAHVFLADNGLPALDLWPEQFRERVNGSYGLRGAEVTLRGTLIMVAGVLMISGTGGRPPVALAPLLASDKIQWSIRTGKARRISSKEAKAYADVAALAKDPGEVKVSVTGPLKWNGAEYILEVRVQNKVSQRS